jgi:hypothetical protein
MLRRKKRSGEPSLKNSQAAIFLMQMPAEVLKWKTLTGWVPCDRIKYFRNGG